MFKKVMLTILLYVPANQLQAQLCTTPGQTPVSANYVCGTASFHQFTLTYCGSTPVPVSCPGGFNYTNKNPNFFRFACYSSGTLGFLIVPDELSADYNWQLFDVTGTNPVDIFTNPNLFVACNWAPVAGETGATDDGTNLIVCADPGASTYTKMPDIQSGRSYILMVSNESGSTGGYTLTFGGGSASITDAINPHLRNASLSCDRTKIYLFLNKQLTCNTVASNGSDFVLSSGANVVGASPDDCTSTFGADRITLTLDQPLAYGSYTLRMALGSDGNTLIDICNRSIPENETIPVLSAPVSPTPMDSLIAARCSPAYIELIFKDPIACSSIAPDGSDFIITGPQTINPGVTLSACAASATTKIIRLDLPPGYLPGIYQVKLVTGSDGNTIINECGIETPGGGTLDYTVVDGVSAQFTNSNATSCSGGTVQFDHNGGNGVTSWNWDFGNGNTSTVANPLVVFPGGNFTVKLTVTNGTCLDTWSKNFSFSTQIVAAFTSESAICPGDTLHLENTSQGTIDHWEWNFGNGSGSFVKSPVAPRYADLGREALYAVQLIAANSSTGCGDTTTRMVRVLANCFIGVPTAFSPNGDGRNDFLYPLNAVKARDLDFRVFNRYGQLVFATRDWTRKWDGKINGILQDTGVYAWLLSYFNPDTKEKVFLKGTVLLIR